MDGLNAKQQRFVLEMLVDGNATAAYKRAGYAARGQSAEVNASRLLRNAKVRDALKKARDERAKRTEVTADRVVKELARIAFTDMRSYAEWGPQGVALKNSEELTEDDAAAVTEVSESYGEHGKTLKFKLSHKDSALKMLAQHTGVFDAAMGGRDPLDDIARSWKEGMDAESDGDREVAEPLREAE